MFSRRMVRKFNRIYKEACQPTKQIPFDPQGCRLVIFSDHHKGDGSAADDFKKNARLYEKALDYYQSQGYRLLVVGDNEELWENSYDQILPHYKDLIQKEIDLALENPFNKKKIRIWGNHDKEVSLSRFKRYCRKRQIKVLEPVDHREGLCLGPDIFIIHGHQGRFFDDKAWRISRWAVHFIWKTIQRLFHIGIDGPAENVQIREDLELQYYNWAKKMKIMLICGHTHRAMFASLTHYDRLRIEIQYLENSNSSSLADQKNIRKEIERKKREMKRILQRRQGLWPKSLSLYPQLPIPCYFNDGCCGYTNGITCLEIDKGLIRLIKWERSGFHRRLLLENSLQLLLNYIKAKRPIDELLEPKLKRLPP